MSPAAPGANGPDPVSRRIPLLAGLAALLAFLGLTALLVADPGGPPFDGADRAVTRAAAGSRTDALTAMATALHHACRFPWNIPLMLAVAAGALYARRHWTGVALVIGSWVLTSAITVPLVKRLLDRDRPLEGLVHESSASFPSGHVAFAAVLGCTVVAITTRYRGWAVLGAVLFTAAMAWSRVYLGAHWLSDTLAGALIGAAIPLLAWWLWLRGTRRREERAGSRP